MDKKDLKDKENMKDKKEDKANEIKDQNKNIETSSKDSGCENCSKASENICKEGGEEENKNDKKESSKEENKETSKEESELEKAKKEALDFEDKYKRLFAEFDNFRKRTDKEKVQMCDIGATVVLTKILPIVDNIERALENVPEDLKGNAFVEGVDKTYKQIMKTFEEMEVKPIEAIGKTFDASLHNAVMTDEESDAKPDTITDELQKGYMYKDQVLRHSMVKVKK